MDDKKTAVLLGLLVASFVLTGGMLLKHFPSLTADEVVVAVASDNFVRGQGVIYTLYDTLFAPSVYELRGVTTQNSRLAYAAWVGLWTRFLPRTLPHVRWSSLSAAALALLALF